jgi:serine/threonine protein kinase, bacterial
MKHLFRLFQFSLLSVLLFNSSCKEKKEPILLAPSISDFSPKSGTKNTIITITGDGFGEDASNIKVTVNSKAAEIISVSNKSISAKIPARAFTGLVSVTVNGVESSFGIAFEYLTSTAQITDVINSSGTSALYCQGNNVLFAALGNSVSKLTLNQGSVNSQEIVSASSGLSNLSGITSDGVGNLYLSDLHKISKINTSGALSVIAGTANFGNVDGNGTTARFNMPSGIGFNGSNNLFVADLGNNKIRKIDIASDLITTYFAGNIQNPKNLFFQEGICYIADQGNYQVKKLSSNGLISTFAGSSLGYADGVGTAAKFGSNINITADGFGNTLVADRNNSCIRIISKSGRVNTLVGGTTSIIAGTPESIAADINGNIYYYDAASGNIRKVVFE